MQHVHTGTLTPCFLLEEESTKIKKTLCVSQHERENMFFKTLPKQRATSQNRKAKINKISILCYFFDIPCLFFQYEKA